MSSGLKKTCSKCMSRYGTRHVTEVIIDWCVPSHIKDRRHSCNHQWAMRADWNLRPMSYRSGSHWHHQAVTRISAASGGCRVSRLSDRGRKHKRRWSQQVILSQSNICIITFKTFKIKRVLNIYSISDFYWWGLFFLEITWNSIIKPIWIYNTNVPAK